MARIVERRPYPLFIYGLVLILMTVVEALLVAIGSLSLPFLGPMMIILPVFIVVGLWLGSWGVLAGFFGWFLAKLLGAGLTITDPSVIILSLLSAFQGLLLIAVPSAIFSVSNADLGMRRVWDAIVCIIGEILSCIVLVIWIYLSGALTAVILSGTISTEYIASPAGVIIGTAEQNLLQVFIPVLVLTPVLLRVLTPYARHTILYLRSS